MSANPSPTAAKPEWAAIYAAVQKTANIPDVSGVDRDQLSVTVRGMYVNLKDAVGEITKAPDSTGADASGGVPDGTSLQIYCDVLAIPANYSLTLDGTAVLIAARRIEVAGAATITLDCRRSDITTLAVFALEFDGTLNASVIATADANTQTQSYDVAPVTLAGVQVTKDGREVLEGIQDPGLGSGSPLELSLVSIFQFATVLFPSRPEIARSMLQWVKQSTADTPAASDLYLQSSSLLVMLDADVTFVPYLSRPLYQEEGHAFLEAAQAYEQQYQRFSDKTEDIDSRVKVAGLMLDSQEDNSTYVGKLIEQTNSNLDSATKAVAAAEAQFHSQQNRVGQAQVAFESGLEKWKYDKTVEAAFKIVGAVVDFAALAGEMMASGGAAGAHGAAGPGEVANVGRAVETVAKAAESNSALEKAMKAIGKLTETLMKTYEIARKLAEVQAISDGTSLSDLPDTDSSEGDPIAAWSVFKLHADAALKTAVDNDVPSAPEYQVELDTLVVYAQSLASSRLSFIGVSQEMVRLKLQQQMAQNQQTRLEAYVKDLKDAKTPNLAMQQMFFQRYVDMKRWLYISMQNYAAAFRYWAMRDASPIPPITANVADFKRAMAQVVSDYNTVLTSFDPPPQNAQNLTCEIADPQTLNALKQNGTARWIIDLNEGTFAGMDRVRLSSVQVWLEGAQGKTATSTNPAVTVQIENSGSYQDRLKGEIYRFSAGPLRRLFKYNLGNNEVVVPGTVADEQRFAYFQPTPFSEWSIKVDAAANPNVDLSNVTAIRMEFEASIISNLS